ncbi:hypothetical protein N7456_002882 [Penicillium angulare]|uniref:PPPDE domain-containing protein n=1 Tax=Penicillium angulare TaxID=116970 RepID=A0A9W9FV20_9EURO|nr:hypothetical protein N7456_002882 [Penicillium angulare]
MSSGSESAKKHVITGLVGGFVGGTVALILIAILIRRVHRPDPNINIGSRPPPRRKATRADIRHWYRGALDNIVTAPLLKESNMGSGEPIFLSHYIRNGNFRHWALHIYSHKYELRQRITDDSTAQTNYVAEIKPSGFDLNKYQRFVTINHSPEVGYFVYSLIGWTHKPKEKVDDICFQVSEEFGTYSLLSNNCHDFLQRLANRIIGTKAPDWDWFRGRFSRRSQYSERPPLGYHIIAASIWARQLSRLKHQLSPEEQQKVDELIAILDELVERSIKENADSVADTGGNGSGHAAGHEGGHSGHYNHGHHAHGHAHHDGGHGGHGGHDGGGGDGGGGDGGGGGGE